MSNSKKLAFFLPNTFTALNMGCGFASIILSWQGRIYPAAMIIVLGAIFDSVDGRVARMTGTQSQFGEQFDSMSDLITFGAAPAFIMYNQFFSGLGRLGMVAAFLYLLCGALRLARFNANIEKVSSDFFQGLPIPTAAISIIGFALLALEFPEVEKMAFMPWLAMAYTVFYAILMISNIPFNSFKNSDWVRKRKRRAFAFLLLLLVLIFAYEEVMIGAITMLYVFGCLAYFFTHKGALENIFEWESEGEEENETTP
jgi:CDP-diacylglycerol--serine O-phosphatidyltransferase